MATSACGLNRSGVYRITCADSGRVYVGSASNIRKRWKLHRTHLRMGVHHNKHLQSAWAKYGETRFVFDVLEFCEAETLVEIEQKWLDSTRAYVRGVGFNVLARAYSSIGLKHSPETRAKLSEIALKRGAAHLQKYSDERRGKPGVKGRTGWVWTDAQRLAASVSRKGRIPWNKGVPTSEETKEKIAKSLIGANRTIPEETRAEILRLRNAGMSYPKIAKETGVSTAQCHKIYHGNTGGYVAVPRTAEKFKGVAAK